MRRPYFQRDEALRQRDAARVAFRDAAEAAQAAQVVLRDANVGVVYAADGMVLRDKNIAALAEPRFREAHAAAAPALQIDFRAYVCCWAAKRAARLPGDFVECGVNEGWMSLTICHYLNFNALQKSFYLFDTYCGIPPEQITDRERRDAGERLLGAQHYYVECYERTKARFATYPRAVLVRGRVPDTLALAPIEQIAYLHIDMNIAVPERAAIEFFWPKLVPGGIVVLDDYAFSTYQSQHDTMNEFAASVGTDVLTLPTGQGLIIK